MHANDTYTHKPTQEIIERTVKSHIKANVPRWQSLRALENSVPHRPASETRQRMHSISKWESSRTLTNTLHSWRGYSNTIPRHPASNHTPAKLPPVSDEFPLNSRGFSEDGVAEEGRRRRKSASFVCRSGACVCISMCVCMYVCMFVEINWRERLHDV